MKKLFFLASALLFVAVSTQAQYYHSRPHKNEKTYDNGFRPSFVLIGGINIANIIKDGGQNFHTNTKIGANVGAGFDLPIVYPLSITVEGLYSQKGYTAQTTDGQFKQRTDFIDVPVLAKIHIVPGFNVLVGPQVSFLLQTKNYYDNGFSQTVEQHYNNTADGYTKSLIGGVAGISLDVSRNIELRGRYNIDLARNNENGDQYVPAYRNQAWQVGLGIKF